MIPAIVGESLASTWEAEPHIRQRLRETGTVCQWKNAQLIGLASVEAMTFNLASLEILASWWTRKVDTPQAVPINLVRDEAGVKKQTTWSNLTWWGDVGSLFPLTCNSKLL